MQPLRDAIKSKYGVSDSEANQVIAALAEVEKHRQDAAGSQVQGLRARQPGDPTGGKVEIPDIDTIIGRSTGGSSGSSRSTSVNVNGTGLIGIILTIVKIFLGLFMARQQTQSGSGSGAVTSILTDLLGGATNPSQAPDLTNIIGSLLGGGQSDQVNEIANSMLGNQPQKGRLTGPKSSQR